MRAVRCSVCLGGCQSRGVSAYGVYTTTSPLWTEFLTHACENITFPQRSCEGYVFTPVCLSTGGLPQCLLGYHPPRADTPPWPLPRDQGPLGSRYPPGSRHPPPSRRLLLRTVRILLECILVINFSPPPPSFRMKEYLKTAHIVRVCAKKIDHYSE